MAAAERFCIVRDSALARVQAGDPGWNDAMEALLAAPGILDDYCAERGEPHDHDHELERPVGTTPVPRPDGPP